MGIQLGGLQLPQGNTGGFWGVSAGFGGVFLLLACLVIAAYFLVVYVLQALGLYRIAKRRGLRHCWLAWIPVGSLWALGNIADHYQATAHGRICNRRGTMVKLMILFLLISAVSGSIAGIASGCRVLGIVGSDVLVGASMAITLICDLVALGLSIWLLVLQYIALCDLYRSCCKRWGVPLLIISIVCNAAMPYLIFGVSGRDAGMPLLREGDETDEQELQLMDEPAEETQPQEEAEPEV